MDQKIFIMRLKVPVMIGSKTIHGFLLNNSPHFYVHLGPI